MITRKNLVLTEGSSDKFWTIEVEGTEVTVHYGRQGTTGQTKTKQYDTAETAQAEAARQIASKERKGYVPQGHEQPARPQQSSAELPPAVTGPGLRELPEAVIGLGLRELSPFEAAYCLDATPTVEESPEVEDLQAARKRIQRICQVHCEGWWSRDETVLFSEPPLNSIPTRKHSMLWKEYAANANRKKGIQLPPSVSLPLRVSRDGVDATLLAWRELSHHELLAARALLPQLSEQARAELDRSLPPVTTWAMDLHALVLGAVLGGREAEVHRALESLDGQSLYGNHQVDATALCAGTPDERVRVADRTGAPIAGSTAMLPWLISTGEAGLAYLTTRLLATGAESLRSTTELAAQLLHGTAAVPLFVALLETPVSARAAQWLTEHPAEMLAADLTADQASSLLYFLRDMADPPLRRVADQPGALSTVAAQVLEERDLPQFDAATPWWQEAVAAAEGLDTEGKIELPPFAQPHLMTPLMIDGCRLSDAETGLVVTALAGGDIQHPLLRAIRDNVDPQARDRFALSVLDNWLLHNGPTKQLWMMTATGVLADDGYVERIAALVRQWPLQSLHQRAGHGLTALRNVGTDAALRQLSDLAARVKFNALRNQANVAMQEVAADLGLTRDQVEDRLVPTVGFSSRGTREFHYGPRSFVASLDGAGKVTARLVGPDGLPTGRARASLPTPNQADDPQAVQDAKAQWSAMKKEMRSLTTTQVARYEQAMVSGRRWAPAEHAEHVAAHPIIRRLLAGLVWGSYDGPALVGTGRLDDDGALVDTEDRALEVAGRTIGIVHPLELSPSERDEWTEVLTDYELTAPFPQLERAVFTLTPQEQENVDLPGLPTNRFPGVRVAGLTNKGLWKRSEVVDNGNYYGVVLNSSSADLTVVLWFTDGLFVGMPLEVDDLKWETGWLFRGHLRNIDFSYSIRDVYPDPLPWSAAPATLISEVLATAHQVARP